MNKCNHGIMLILSLGLLAFTQLTQANQAATDKGVMLLAEDTTRFVRCGRGESIAACKQRHGDYRFHSKHKHHHHSKAKHKHKHKHKSKSKSQTKNSPH